MDLSSSGGIVKLTTLFGKLSPVSDNHDGTYTAVLTSAKLQTMVMIGGTIAGGPIGHIASVRFVKSTKRPPTGSKRDTQAPLVAAYPTQGKRGKLVKLRFFIYDDSGFAKWTTHVYRHERSLVSFRSRGPAKGTAEVVWKAPKSAVSLKFCVRASDASNHRSKESCAPLWIR